MTNKDSIIKSDKSLKSDTILGMTQLTAATDNIRQNGVILGAVFASTIIFGLIGLLTFGYVLFRN